MVDPSSDQSNLFIVNVWFDNKTCAFKVSMTFASARESWCLQGVVILRLGTKGQQSLSPVCQPPTISITCRFPLRFCCQGTGAFKELNILRLSTIPGLLVEAQAPAAKG